MAEITSLDQCFNLDKIEPYVKRLKSVKKSLQTEAKDIINNNAEDFSSKAFHCSGNVEHATLQEDANKVIKSIKASIKGINNSIKSLRKNARLQRKKDLTKYIKYCEQEKEKYQAALILKTNIDKTNSDIDSLIIKTNTQTSVSSKVFDRIDYYNKEIKKANEELNKLTASVIKETSTDEGYV